MGTLSDFTSREHTTLAATLSVAGTSPDVADGSALDVRGGGLPHILVLITSKLERVRPKQFS